MQPLLEMARFLALDFFTQFKLQCVIKSFNFYTRVEIAVVAPVAFAALVVLVCVLLAMRRQGQRRRQAIMPSHSTVEREKRRGSHGSAVKSGLWTAAPIVLMTIDLVFPTITRTLCQYFTCRSLGGAGRWLEADYAVECDTDVYNKHSVPVAVAAVVYSIGIPALFVFLVYRFKNLGKAGDKVVAKALSWMYQPYRAQKEWWLGSVERVPMKNNALERLNI